MSTQSWSSSSNHALRELFWAAVIAVPLAACSTFTRQAVTPDETPHGAAPGFFSAAQADRGRASYDRSCSECHALSEFRSADFEWSWRRQSAWDLYRSVSENMPEDNPGKLSPTTYTDIVAYLLSLNGYQIGSADLAATEEALRVVQLGPGAPKTKLEE